MTDMSEKISVKRQDDKNANSVKQYCFLYTLPRAIIYILQKSVRNISWWKPFKVFVGNIVSLATLLFVGAYTVVTYWQYDLSQRQFSKQNVDLRDSARQTQDALAAANKTAIAAGQQAAIAREAEIETLRPYVSLLLSDIPRIDDKYNVHIRRRFINTGKSVALDVQRVIWLQIGNGDIPGDGAELVYPTDQQVAATSEIDYLPPGREQNASTDAVGWPVDPVIWNRLISGVSKLTFIEYGTVLYKDVFGNTHHMWMCHYWQGVGQTVGNCQRGNRMN